MRRWLEALPLVLALSALASCGTSGGSKTVVRTVTRAAPKPPPAPPRIDGKWTIHGQNLVERGLGPQDKVFKSHWDFRPRCAAAACDLIVRRPLAYGGFFEETLSRRGEAYTGGGQFKAACLFRDGRAQSNGAAYKTRLRLRVTAHERVNGQLLATALVGRAVSRGHSTTLTCTLPPSLQVTAIRAERADLP